MIELFALPVSAYCAKVRCVLRLKGLDFAEHAPPGGYGSAEYRAIVPAGSIPAIRIDDFVLHDSDAIVEYLEDLVPEPALWPADARERARLRAVARYHDTALEPAVRALFPLVAPRRDARAVAHALAGVERALQRLNALVRPGPFLWGSRISLADCGFPPTLRMAEDIAAALHGSLTVPRAIGAWIEALEAEPAPGASVAECRAGVADWIGRRLQG